MKTTLIKTGVSYAYNTRQSGLADQVWLLSHKTYVSDWRADVARGEKRYSLADQGGYRSAQSRYSYGLLAIMWTDTYVTLDEDLVQLLDKVTVDEVLNAQGLPQYVKTAFEAKQKSLPEIRILMPRGFIDEWAPYKAAKQAANEARIERQERAQNERYDRMERRENVIAVFNKVLATDERPEPIRFSEYGDHRKVELDLEDAERLADVLRQIFPGMLKNN